MGTVFIHHEHIDSEPYSAGVNVADLTVYVVEIKGTAGRGTNKGVGQVDFDTAAVAPVDPVLFNRVKSGVVDGG